MLGGKQVSVQPFEVTGLEGIITSRVEKSTQLRMFIEENQILEMDAHIVKELVGVLPKARFVQ